MQSQNNLNRDELIKMGEDGLKNLEKEWKQMVDKMFSAPSFFEKFF